MWREFAKAGIYSIGILLLMGLGLKVWVVIQHQYVCEPKAKETVHQFISNMSSASFETLADKTMFIDKDQFVRFQQAISEKYSAEITDWRRPVQPTLLVRFSPNIPFAFMLVTDIAPLPFCWGANYEVLTVR